MACPAAPVSVASLSALSKSPAVAARAVVVGPARRLGVRKVQAAGGKSAQTRGSRRRMPAPPRAEGRVEAEASSTTSASAAPTLESGLAMLDSYLQPSESNPAKAQDEPAAVKLMVEMKEAGVLRGFGGASEVPKRNYTLEELRLNKIFPEKLLSPQDKTLQKISDRLTVAAVAGVGALAYGQHWDFSQLLGAGVLVLLGMTVDQVAAGGGVSALLLDTIGRATSPTYKGRVAAHEAGHFLVAYLLGLLPQAYTLSSLEAYQRYKAFNVQAGTVFCDADFQAEVAGGKLSSSTLGRYTCVALAGVATEYLQYDVAEGGMGDVQQLDGMLRALNFSQAKADGEIRWAVLNVIALLRRHEATHRRLADAMLAGESVAGCVAIIEESLAGVEDI